MESVVTNNSSNIVDKSCMNGTEILDFANVSNPIFDEGLFDITDPVINPDDRFNTLSSADIAIPTSDVKVKINSVQVER